MSVTREELAAFADGQLEEPRHSEVAAAIADDRALAAEVERHHELRRRLASHFAPILDEQVPDELTALLGGGEPKVADLDGERQRRATRGFPRWGWVVGPALAASLALAVFLPRGTPEGYAQPQLADALNGQLVATQPSDAPTRVLLSFRDHAGEFCRAFARYRQSGIACKDATGWKLAATTSGEVSEQGQYKMAGSAAATIMARAQEMAAGPALSAQEEQEARARGWR
jgi:anti-sigma factor RsiW